MPEGFFTRHLSWISAYVGGMPELRFTPKGQSVCNVSVAYGGYENNPPTWINLVFWDKNAEMVNHLLKSGDAIEVYGRISQVRAYVAKDGSAKPDVKMSPEELTIVSKSGKRTKIDLVGRDEDNGSESGSDDDVRARMEAFLNEQEKKQSEDKESPESEDKKGEKKA